jgi:tripartite-type tricarboxylate transporter receptor subunit TctC
MEHPGSRLRSSIAGSLLALAAASAGAAYPERPIHIIVPYPPGGLTDAVARQVGKSLSERLKQPVVIENVGGGGGNIGAQRAARSPADGYTLYIGNNATVGINTLIYKQLPFDPIKELAPISLVAESQTILVVHPSLPVKSVAELVAYAKSRPGQLNFGSTGTGGLSHLAGEMLKSSAGIQMTHIPYKGTGPALTDLLAGQIQLMFNDTAAPHIKSGKLRALAVTGTRRWAELPEVPTLGELGVAGYETYNWFGILAPAGTPADVIAMLNRELVAVMKDPAMQAWMQSRGAEAASGSVEEFSAYIRRDLAKWSRVVKETGVTAE